MAEKNYKLGEAIEIVYQAPNKQSGLSGVVAEIILPGAIQDSNFPDVSLVEILSKGIYKGQFTPDQEGDWEAICHKADGDGQVVKRYSVGGHNVDSVGQVVSNINTVVTDIDGDIAAVDGKVDVVDDKVEAAYAKATSIESKVDDIDTKVSSLDTPPMVS